MFYICAKSLFAGQRASSDRSPRDFVDPRLLCRRRKQVWPQYIYHLVWPGVIWCGLVWPRYIYYLSIWPGVTWRDLSIYMTVCDLVWQTGAAAFGSLGRWPSRGTATWRTGDQAATATPIRWVASLLYTSVKYWEKDWLRWRLPVLSYRQACSSHRFVGFSIWHPYK